MKNKKSGPNTTMWKEFRYNLIHESSDDADILNEGKVNFYYDKIIADLREITRQLNDDDAFELHEKLKEFFNRAI